MAQGGTAPACTRSGRTRNQGRWGSSRGTRLETGLSTGRGLGIQPRLGRFPPHSMGVVGAGRPPQNVDYFRRKAIRAPPTGRAFHLPLTAFAFCRVAIRGLYEEASSFQR